MMMMMAVKDRHQQLACIHDKQVHPQSPLERNAATAGAGGG